MLRVRHFRKPEGSLWEPRNKISGISEISCAPVEFSIRPQHSWTREKEHPVCLPIEDMACIEESPNRQSRPDSLFLSDGGFQ
jgi:hypothetical protein